MTTKEFTEKYGLISIIASIIVASFTIGGTVALVSGRWFSSVEDRIKAEEHNRNAPTDVDAYIMFQKWDSARTVDMANKEHAIKSRERRDSIMAVQDSTLQAMFKLLEKDVVTNYQTKKIVDSTNTYWKEYNESVKRSQKRDSAKAIQ